MEGATHEAMIVARRAMIDSQLRASGVNTTWVLAAMGSLAREDFVPPAMRQAAYIDRAIPLGNGRFLAAPLVQGRMLGEATPLPADVALLVGDADGYLAALLRPLVGTLETRSPADIVAPGTDLPAGRYTLVVIDGAVEVLPEAIARSLTEDGRVITGQVARGVTRLATARMIGGTLTLVPLSEMGIPALPEFAAPKRWSF